MEQLERARRYLDRIHKIYKGTSIPWEERDYLKDDVISFFMHCYHIKDWIIQLSKVKVTHQEIDNFINKQEALKICTDLCNGSKHCKLTQKTRTEGQPHIALSEYQSSGKSGGSIEPELVTARFSVLSNQEDHDALELAEECMALWDGFTADLQATYSKADSADAKSRAAD